MKLLFFFLFGIVSAFSSSAQVTFIETQKANPKLAEIFNDNEHRLKKDFARKDINWPPRSIYVRSFKFDRQLEVWVKDSYTSPYKFLKSYKVCAQSGTSGPKRMEGDYQVPEGFYYVNDFNPNSNYHLSLGLNYPNASDRILSDSIHPGSDIYIHGNCVSVGCIAIKDQPVEELYVLACYARSNGQDFIPVHVFPAKYTEKKAAEFLLEAAKGKPAYQKFAANLKEVFSYFEEKKQLPVILINKKGEYIIN
jgi:murein L,D-transpeptidase YafK